MHRPAFERIAGRNARGPWNHRQMPLLLKIFSRTTDGVRLSNEVALEGEIVTVGRSKECTLSLADPERRLSRVHAELMRTPQGYLLKAGSGNSPVLVNGRPLAFSPHPPAGASR